MTLAELQVLIEANAAPLYAELDRARAAVGAFSGFAAASLGMGAIGIGAAAAGAGIYKVFDAGSRLNSLLSKSGRIFGDQAVVIETAADDMAAKFGTLRSSFVSSATDLGLAFKGIGSSREEAAKTGVALAKLAEDLAAFRGHGTTAAEAATALEAALEGSTRSLRHFGIFIHESAMDQELARLRMMGFGRSTDEATRKIAALGVIMRRTKEAQGTLGRTIDQGDQSFGRLWKTVGNLAASVGQILMPAFDALLLGLNKVATAAETALKTNLESLKRTVGDLAFAVKNFGSSWQAAALMAAIEIARIIDIAGQLGPRLATVWEAAGLGLKTLGADVKYAFEVVKYSATVGFNEIAYQLQSLKVTWDNLWAEMTAKLTYELSKMAKQWAAFGKFAEQIVKGDFIGGADALVKAFIKGPEAAEPFKAPAPKPMPGRKPLPGFPEAPGAALPADPLDFVKRLMDLMKPLDLTGGEPARVLREELDKLLKRMTDDRTKELAKKPDGKPREGERPPLQRPAAAFTGLEEFSKKLQLGAFGKDATVTAVEKMDGHLGARLADIRAAIIEGAGKPAPAVAG